MRQSDEPTDKEGFFNSIAVAGLGLIGGSMVKALRAKGYTGRIMGYDQDTHTRQLALESGLFDSVFEGPRSGDGMVELLILAVPLSMMPKVLKDLAAIIGPETLVTDTGSVKSTVHEVAEGLLPKGTAFVGGHPMAGSDRSGFASASPVLFENAYFFLTPESCCRKGHLDKLDALVKRIGAIPVITTSQEHDALVARLSHLPHLTACALVNAFSKSMPVNLLKYAGGGFRDTTRIAMGDPGLWTDIFTQNQNEVMDCIDLLVEELQNFKRQLEEAKSEEIRYNLSRIQKIRSSLAAQRPSEESSLYPLIVDLEDRPGTLAAVTGLLAEQHINIKDMALDHARETLPGALILSFATKDERFRAAHAITEAKLCKTFIEQD